MKATRPGLCAALALVTASLWTPAHAAPDACMDQAQTQAQMTACAGAAFKRADDDLNVAYQQARTRLKGDAQGARMLQDAQRAWLRFRDAECAFATRLNAGGSIEPMNVALCRAELTQARTAQLQKYMACRHDASSDAVCALPPRPQ